MTAAPRSFGRKAARVGLWVITFYEGLLMGSAGVHKLVAFQKFGSAFWGAWFEQWGYPHWFLVAVAVVEICGGVLLFIPRTAFYSACVLTAVMLGAIATTYVHAHDALAPGLRATDMTMSLPTVSLVFLVIIALVRRR